MKLIFAKGFEKWLDPILDSAWHNLPKIISVPIMAIGIIIEFLMYAIQLILSLFLFPNRKKKKKSLLDNPLLEDKDES